MAATFEPSMPEVEGPPDVDLDSVFGLARLAAAGESLPATAPRTVALVTPGRNLFQYACPKPGTLADDGIVSFVTRMVPPSPPQMIAAIAYTDLEKGAIPVFHVLVALEYIGHAVWVFEGHPTAVRAGCRDAQLLLVDGAMLPHMSPGWDQCAAEVMANAGILVLEPDGSGRPWWPDRWAADEMVREAASQSDGGRLTAAIADYELVSARFGERTDARMGRPVAAALFGRGRALTRLGRDDDALPLFDEVVGRFGDRSERDVLNVVGSALYEKGATLERLGRFDQAISVHEEIVARFDNRTEAEFVADVSTAQLNIGADLLRQKRAEDAMRASESLEARLRDCTNPVLRYNLACARVNRGSALLSLGRNFEAIAAYDLVVDGIDADIAPDDPQGLPTATALMKSGAALCELGRVEDAIARWDTAERLCGKSTRPDVNAILAQVRSLRTAAATVRDGRTRRSRRSKRGNSRRP